jgi:hypothetical protein
MVQCACANENVNLEFVLRLRLRTECSVSPSTATPGRPGSAEQLLRVLLHSLCNTHTSLL